METLEKLQRRLETVDGLSGIVRTMKALAAVNIRQYEESSISLGHYYRTIELGLHVLLHDMPSVARPAAQGRWFGAVVFGSDHGMCGRFNERVAERALGGLRDAASKGGAPRIIAVGGRVAPLIEAAGYTLQEDVFVPGSAVRIAATVRQILLLIDEWQATSGAGRVYLFHNRATADGRQHATATRLLPVNLHRFRRLEGNRWPSRSLPTYTMARVALFACLLRQFLFVSVFRGCAESLVAENSSRLVAMQAAERNLAEHHRELVGEFRRQRQEAITTEMLDVVSGYESMRATRSDPLGEAGAQFLGS